MRLAAILLLGVAVPLGAFWSACREALSRAAERWWQADGVETWDVSLQGRDLFRQKIARRVLRGELALHEAAARFRWLDGSAPDAAEDECYRREVLAAAERLRDCEQPDPILTR
jgi:hypothetical protein